ncbi:uncharacterized protein [Triticum aestivum]|uniref:uncharacterized protein n=1 Tax=Triticum aestivum TaxID=4565 RepID=UPI001D00D035|nr:uncharacterized protein LOC123170012 [Triticum aestivum]
MAIAETSPLHRVIDARRWDAERLLGRLIVVVHAAFLDAGFAPHAHGVPKHRRVPRRVGATASTLPLVYAAPRLPDAAVALRMRTHGMRIVFYVCVPRLALPDPGPGVHWACVDALAAAPLMSGGLDGTARALAGVGACGLPALWRELAEKLCRGALVDLCRENAFVSLPGDVTLAVLARLADVLDLLGVASTCTELRCLVADHDSELWKHRYKALCSLTCCDDSPETSWMKGWCEEKQIFLNEDGVTSFVIDFCWFSAELLSIGNKPQCLLREIVFKHITG